MEIWLEVQISDLGRNSEHKLLHGDEDRIAYCSLLANLIIRLIQSHSELRLLQ